MRISDWSSDVCSSDLYFRKSEHHEPGEDALHGGGGPLNVAARVHPDNPLSTAFLVAAQARSEEHTSELQSLMRISYAVFCVKKKQPLPLRRSVMLTTDYKLRTRFTKLLSTVRLP